MNLRTKGGSRNPKSMRTCFIDAPLHGLLRKRARARACGRGLDAKKTRRGQIFSLCGPLVPFCLLLLWTQQVVMGVRADAADVRRLRRDVGFHGQGAYFCLAAD